MLEWAGMTFFQSMNQYLLIGLAVFLGQFVYAAVGFGSGMITISLLTLMFGQVDLFVPFFLLLCLPAELTVAIRDRRHVRLKETGAFLFYITPGLVIGAWVLKSAPDTLLLVALGSLITLLALYYLFFESRFRIRTDSPVWIPVAGTLSGILGGLYGVSGPPLIVYFKSSGRPKRVFRAALLTIFLFMSFFRLAIYGTMQFYTGPILISVLATVPFAAAGVAAGMWSHERISEERFRMVTSLILLISGLLLIVKNV